LPWSITIGRSSAIERKKSSDAAPANLNPLCPLFLSSSLHAMTQGLPIVSAVLLILFYFYSNFLLFSFRIFAFKFPYFPLFPHWIWPFLWFSPLCLSINM
jgi:hypothetical protein